MAGSAVSGEVVRAASRAVVLMPAEVGALVGALRSRGYTVIGPVRRDGAITLGTLESAGDLPVGWTAEQQAGAYRLVRRGDEALFGYAVGAHPWKRFLHPPTLTLWSARRENGHLLLDEAAPASTKLALFGIRPCDLAALARLDRALTGHVHVDATYAAMRRLAFVVVVQCTTPAATCFCASTGSGPRAASGFDLALTEVIGEGDHHLLVEAGSDAGRELLRALSCRPASPEEVARGLAITARAMSSQERSVDLASAHEALPSMAEHPRWEAIASRCLTCGSCTQSCPTCFCTTVDDRVDLSGARAERVRTWDSCFTTEFSYMHGGSVRLSPRSRYRQWLTHKLSTWQDQFGEPGCVGCGRCITWCPVGIDITAEARVFCEAADPRDQSVMEGEP